MAESLTIPLVGPARAPCAWPVLPACPHLARVYVEAPPGSGAFVGVCRAHQRRWERQFAAQIAAHYRRPAGGAPGEGG